MLRLPAFPILALFALLLAPAVGAQNMYTSYGQTSVGLSVLVATPLGSEVETDPAFGFAISGGTARGGDVSLSVLRTPGRSRDVTSISLGASIYFVKHDGLRVGSTFGFSRLSAGRSTTALVAIGAIAAQQLAVGPGLAVPQVTLTGAASPDGGGVQVSGGAAVAGVLPLGRARLLIEPAVGVGFKEGNAAASVRGGVIVSI